MSTAPPKPTPAPPARDVRLLVIHCSATRNGQRVTPAQIDEMHRLRGFERWPHLIGFNQPTLRHIGYHYLIEASGPVTTGRGEAEVGAHVAGFNKHSIGICMAGTDAYSAAQWASLKGLVEGLRRRYPAAEVLGHRDLSPDQNANGIVERFEWLKTCPGFDVRAWLASGMAPPAGSVLGAQ